MIGRTIPQHRQQLCFWTAVSIVLLLGLTLRAGGSAGELWLDEVWSLAIATHLKSATQVFTIHHENNHYLISLWMLVWGARKAWWVYRVPSILAGMGATLAAIRIGWRQSRATALVAGLLMSLSYLAVFYSSEARGYAIACCMALVGYDYMETYLRDRTWWNSAGYCLAIVVGTLGSLTYVSVAAALGVWSMMVMLGQERTRRSAVQFVVLHAAPVALMLALWLVDVRKMIPAPAPEVGIWSVLCETISYTFGLAGSLRLGTPLIVIVFCFVTWQIVTMARRADMRWTFFLTGLIIAPVALIAWTGRQTLFPRYLLVNVYLLYLLAALAIGKSWDANAKYMRWLIGGALATWTLTNLLLSVQLWELGRGHYKDALEFISGNTRGGAAQIGSTEDFRTGVLVWYYARYLPAAKRPEVVEINSLVQVRPEWLLSTISPYEMPELPLRTIMAPGLQYVLVKQFPSVKLSGFTAGVYRRADLSNEVTE